MPKNLVQHVIRPAFAHEAETLTRIAIAAKSHWGYSPEQIERWRGDLAISAETIRTAQVQVAEVDGVPVGVYVLRQDADAWDLEHMWVLPEHMGKGIGRALLEHAASLASRHGATRIAIDADPFAEAFYRTCGAVRVGLVDAPIDGDPARQRPQMVLDVAGEISKSTG